METPGRRVGGVVTGADGGPADGEGALVRLPARAGAWVESVPPVPDGHVVTVSFSTHAAAEEHGDAFALLGYRGVPPPALGPPAPPSDGSGDVAWLVVSSALARAHPLWWRSVRAHADAVFPLALGPVVARYGDVLHAHLSVATTPPP